MSDQTTFRTALLDAAQPAPEGLINPDGAPATRRFDVYRNNVASSLIDALQTAFPVIRKLVGDDFFNAMAAIYVRAHPPTSPVMMFYGDAMPDFLAQFPPAQSVPYLPDMARLELGLRHSYHAADAQAIAVAALADIAPDTLAQATFTFAPCVQLVPSRFALHSIWMANMRGTKPVNGAQPTLITRPDLDPLLDPLSPQQANVTRALMNATPLGIAVQSGGTDFDLGPLIGLLLARHALISIQT